MGRITMHMQKLYCLKLSEEVTRRHKSCGHFDDRTMSQQPQNIVFSICHTTQ